MAADGEAGFELVRLTSADLGEVLDLENRTFAQPWTEANFQGEFARRITLALGFKTAPAGTGRDRNLAAYCFFWLIGPEIHLLNLAVRPEYRRRGLARRLMRTMVGLGRRAGVRVFFLEVRPTNAKALALYRSFGFTAAGRRPGYYGDGEDAQLMTMEIS